MALFAKKQNGCRFQMARIKRNDSRTHPDSIWNIPILCICNLKIPKHIVRVVYGQFLTILK